MTRIARKSNPLVPSKPEIPREPSASYGGDPLRSYHVPVAEVEALVRRSRGRIFFVNAKQFAISPDQIGVPNGSMRGRDVSANVKVTRRHALEFINSAYGLSRESGYLIHITISTHCFFIG